LLRPNNNNNDDDDDDDDDNNIGAGAIFNAVCDEDADVEIASAFRVS
jgi:hypothetical protein